MAARMMARWRCRAAALALGFFVVLTAAACGVTEVPGRTFPVGSIGPDRTVTPTVNLTRAEIVTALAGYSLILADTQTPVRKAEAPLLTTAPRAVYQVTLPKDPTKGFIVVYEFGDPAQAATAAAEEQRYLASGPGRVQTPQGTVYVLRQVGSTLVLYDWLPAAAQDEAAPGIQSALQSLGIDFPIPN